MFLNQPWQGVLLKTTLVENTAIFLELKTRTEIKNIENI